MCAVIDAYDYPSRSTYAEGSHVQDSSVIVQRDSGTQGEFDQNYTAWFTDFLTTSTGGSYHITIYE